MEQYKNLDIVEVPLGSPHFHDKVERFLGANGLRMEAIDSYYAVQDADGNILAGAGISGDVIKCVAVSPDMRSEGLLTPLISRIISGRGNLKVFTKPEYRSLFESLGFKLLASAPLAILLENGRGLQQYCEYLRNQRSESAPASEENYFLGHRPKNQFPSASTTPTRASYPMTPPVLPRTGVIVMNANPFTLGHKYLIDKALEQVDQLYVIPVKEDVSLFPYSERVAMVRASVLEQIRRSEPANDDGLSEVSSAPSCGDSPVPSFADLPNSSFADLPNPSFADLIGESSVHVVEGSAYSISAATFPTYFLKDITDASETQMLLDLDLFCKHIAPALGATVRFAGSEPTDKLTAQYNKLMAEVLPKHGIDFVEIPRLTETPGTEAEGDEEASSSGMSSPSSSGMSRRSQVVSATNVREALVQGDYRAASAMCPATTRPYLLAALAERALRMELDTPMKPGLVCPESCGAHKDMDYGTMLKGIAAIRPFFPRMATASTPEELKQLGIDAESAMMAATGGVNTHRGAIFALGLALNACYSAFSADPREMQLADTQRFIQNSCSENTARVLDNSLIDNEFHFTPIGAKRIALEGYQQLFEDWLPFYRAYKTVAGPCPAAIQALLLHIMSTLDDTCIIKRVGKERAEQLKEEIRRSSRRMTEEGSRRMTEGSGRMTEGSSRRMTEEGSGRMTGSEPVNDGVLTELCKQFEAEGISPGGAADMVALTIFMDSII